MEYMSITERKLRVKFQNSIGDKLENLLGTREVFFQVPESKELYKKLSTDDDVEDWDWVEEENVNQTTGVIKTAYPDPHPDSISIPSCSSGPSRLRLGTLSETIDYLNLTNFQEIAILINAIWKVSLDFPSPSSEGVNFRIIETYHNIKGVLTRSFDVMGVKLYLESEFSSISDCREELKERLAKRWDILRKQPTFLAAFTELFSKVN